MYYLLGICLALGAFYAVNALATLGAAAAWRGMAAPARRWSATTRSRIAFALRVLPPANALVLTGALLVPAYLIYEPRPVKEAVTLKLLIPALLALFGLALALLHAFAAWRATRQLAANWLEHAEPISLGRISPPTYRIPHQFPVIAVVGSLRPRLFLASCIFDSLDEAELAAALAHERGHIAARDNLKRLALRACHDLLVPLPCGRALDRAWLEASEAAADEYAAQAGAAVTLDLASALVKIARLAPLGTRPAMPAGASLINDADSSIAWRIQRLAQLADAGGNGVRRGARAVRLAIWAGLCSALLLVALAATDPDHLHKIHTGYERVVWALQ
jgi:Zn-dependent protease with chaperone function